jgi:hypothetical protein
MITNKENKELQIKNYSLEKMSDMNAMAKTLKAYVVKNNLYTTIQGKNYTHVDAWQVSGGMLGLYPRVVKITDMSKPNEIKWLVEVEIINKDEKIISRGFAICSNKEGKKSKFDEYAILSQAQTRAIGRAFRNTIGYVMKLAGYESTPSEEMGGIGNVPQSNVQTELVSRNEGIDDIPEDHVCLWKGCGKDITTQEANYSLKMFKRELCREHQMASKTK